MAISKFKAVAMGSEYHTLMRNAQQADDTAKRAGAGRSFAAEDFKRRAEIVKAALTMHGWTMAEGGLVVTRSKS